MTRDLVAQFQELENRRTGYLLAGNLDAVESMLADTLVYGHSTGLVDNKCSLLSSLRQRTVRYLSISPEISEAVAIEKNVVVTGGLITIRAVVKGEEGTFGGRYMAVWHRVGAEWLLAALQATNAGQDGS